MNNLNYFTSRIIMFLLLFCSTNLFSQNSIYIAREYQLAYQKNTRNLNGTPGKEYWQNKSVYDIKAKVDVNSKIIIGEENITYFNNSPDSLSELVIKLLMDIYKKSSPRDFPIDTVDLTDGVLIKKLLINEKEINLDENKNAMRFATNLIIKLEQNIPPKSKTELRIEWEAKIPTKSLIRMGAYDSTSIFMAYWYPQIAVYDDIHGWDKLFYTGQTETYNDFNDYNIEITVPNTFGVWGTGIWQNPDEILNEKYLELYNQALNSDSVVNIIKEDDLTQNNIFNKAKSELTYKFKSNNVMDCAYGMSDHFLWDAVNLNLPSKKILVQAVYKKESPDFRNVAKIAKQVLDFLSNDLPGVPYPYPVMTVFNSRIEGGGGMEFPMIVNDGSASSFAGTAGLTAHEIAHTYFPFLTGINERRYAWMDEGWATFLPYEFQEKVGGINPRPRTVSSLVDTSIEYDLPLMIPSSIISGVAYRNNSYSKPATVYYILRDYLGDDLFKKSLKEYINRWAGKHPIPYDFFFTFNDMAKEDLSWLWKPWFFKIGTADLSIKDYKINDNKIIIKVEKVGALPIPVDLKIKLQNGDSIQHYEKASIWKDGNNIKEFEIKVNGKIDSIELGNENLPDADKKNNYILIKTGH